MENFNENDVKYMAIFFDKETQEKLISMQKEGDDLPKKPSDIHCTFRFRPSLQQIEKFSEIVGKKQKIRIVGYASDGRNTGFLVDIGEEMEEYYSNNRTDEVDGMPKVVKVPPHITTSFALDGSAVNTGKLDFKPLPEDEIIEIDGTAGFFVVDRTTGEGKVIYEAPLNEKTNELDKNEENLAK